MAPAKILFVDDEEYVLKAIARFCYGAYEIQTARTTEQAIATLTADNSYAAVVTDLRMPGMSGIDFLRHAYEFSPRTTRLLLTGRLDTGDALRAVNEGHVFQILVKPCPVPTMMKALGDAVRHHQSLVAGVSDAQEALCDSTVKLLSEVLEIVNPLASSRAARLKDLAVAIAGQMGVEWSLEYDRATKLSQLGCIDTPRHVLASLAGRIEELSEKDAESLIAHPALAYQLLSPLPYMSDIANAVAHQTKNFDGTGSPETALSGDDIPLASRILRAATDFDDYARRGLSPKDAINSMGRNARFYDPKVLAALKAVHSIEETTQLLELDIDEICVGMTLERAVGTTDGRTLLAKGSHVTENTLARLKAFARTGNVQQPILVSATVSRVATAPSASVIPTDLQGGDQPCLEASCA